MPKISEVRAQFPMYQDVPDDQLLIALHRKHYADMPFAQFNSAIERDTERDRLNAENLASMGTTGRFLAGAGKSFSDVGRSVKRLGNMVGIGDYDQAAAQADEQLDKPLMGTTAGTVGNIGGDIALTAVPMLKGAQVISGATKALTKGPGVVRGVLQTLSPYAAAGDMGALTGAMLSPEDMGQGALVGYASGATGEALGRVAPAAWQGVKSMVEPLTEKGRERVLKRALERFATNPANLAGAANPATYVKGSNPTLAEATMDPGIAALERQFPAQMSDRYLQNNAARIAHLRALGATPEQIAAMEASREGAANALYGQTFAADAARRAAAQPARAAVSPVTDWGAPVAARAADELSTSGLRELASRPAFQAAIREAKTLAANMGEDIGDPLTSAKGLHYIKMALDEGFKNPQSSLASFGQRALASTKDTLLTEIDKVAPTYGAARQTFADMSQPINRAQVANELFKRGTTATENAMGDPMLQAAAFSRALRGGDQLAQNVTGFNKATLPSVMGDQAMLTINALRKDLSRSQAAQNVGRGVGSPTAQNLAAQNTLARIAGPLGIPNSFLSSQVANIMAGALGLPVKLTQDQTEALLVRALSDPKLASQLLATKDPRVWIDYLRPYAATLIAGSTGGSR
jgi:hypothetical protein